METKEIDPSKILTIANQSRLKKYCDKLTILELDYLQSLIEITLNRPEYFESSELLWIMKNASNYEIVELATETLAEVQVEVDSEKRFMKKINNNIK